MTKSELKYKIESEKKLVDQLITENHELTHSISSQLNFSINTTTGYNGVDYDDAETKLLMEEYNDLLFKSYRLNATNLHLEEMIKIIDELKKDKNVVIPTIHKIGYFG